MAKFGDANPFSEAVIKPAQSAYLQFILGMETVRGLGQAGASARNIFVPGQRPGAVPSGIYSVTPRLSPYGGVPDAWSQKLFDLTGKPAARWSAGGVFWSARHGKTGFWARPKRTKAVGGKSLASAQKRTQNSFELRQRGADGRFITTGRENFRKAGGRQRADARVTNRGVPILLLLRETQTHHHKLIDYDAIMQAAHARSIGMLQQRFNRYLN